MTCIYTMLLGQAVATYGNVLGLVIVVLQIIAVISVLAGNGAIGHKVLWTVVILLLPVVGLILYALLGRSSRDRPLLE